MENLKKIKRIAVWLAVLFGVNLVLLALMLPGFNLWTISVIVVQVVVVIYFVGIIMALLREMREVDEKYRKAGEELQKARENEEDNRKK